MADANSFVEEKKREINYLNTRGLWEGMKFAGRMIIEGGFFAATLPAAPEEAGIATTAEALGAREAVASFANAFVRGERLVLYSRSVPRLGPREVAIRISNWSLRANDEIIRAAIESGRPIRDSYVDKETGELLKARANSVLYREREQLMRAGWKFDVKSGEWKANNVCIGTRLATENPC
jgi:hypothetical protein